jgi:hypothetical protein
MASGASERPVVLRRLGIVKDENDTAFLQPPPAPVDVAEDGLESFGSETQSRLSLKAVGGRIASAIAVAGRNPWVAVAIVAVVSLMATVLVITVLFGSPEPPVTAAANTAASSNSAAAADDVNPLSGTATIKAKAASAVAPVAARPSAARTAPASARSTQSVVARSGSKPLGTETLRRPEVRSSVAAPVAPETVIAGAASSPAQDVPLVDDRIYSAEDSDVVPPRTSETLPGPTISSWTTRTNVVELIVSNDGTVERARFVGAPQRMPDVLALSRAKVWKFTPAMKDGRPVRYRLLLKWEVNP